MHADIPAGEEHVWSCSDGLMVIIWAGNLSWDLIRVLLWYEGQDFVGDLVSKMPCPAEKSGDLSASKEGVWLRSPASARVPGG